MSVPVALDELAASLAEHPWGYLLTVGSDGRPRVLAVPTEILDGVVHCRTGASARSNVGERPLVTMVFPPAVEGSMSLIVDGEGVAIADGVAVHPTSAVLHRAATGS